MKKRWTALAGVLLVSLLAGCEKPAAGISPQPTGEPSAPAESAAPAPTPTEAPESKPSAPAESAAPVSVPAEVSLDPDLEPPLTEFSANIAVPDFLTQEQQDLYRRAHCLYQAMFGGETTAIDNPYVFPATEDVEWEYHDEDYWAVGEFGWHYTPARGRYQRWADFDALVHSVFTEDFWQRRNILETGDPIYRDFDGRLGILDFSKGGGWYNHNFPDQFRLEEQTEDAITFTLICPYTEPYPKDGETYEERDRRLETVVDYTLEFPMKLVLTGDGWRFDEFHFGPTEDSGPVGE